MKLLIRLIVVIVSFIALIYGVVIGFGLVTAPYRTYLQAEGIALDRNYTYMLNDNVHAYSGDTINIVANSLLPTLGSLTYHGDHWVWGIPSDSIAEDYHAAGQTFACIFKGSDNQLKPGNDIAIEEGEKHVYTIKSPVLVSSEYITLSLSSNKSVDVLTIKNIEGFGKTIPLNNNNPNYLMLYFGSNFQYIADSNTRAALSFPSTSQTHTKVTIYSSNVCLIKKNNSVDTINYKIGKHFEIENVLFTIKPFYPVSFKFITLILVLTLTLCLWKNSRWLLTSLKQQPVYLHHGLVLSIGILFQSLIALSIPNLLLSERFTANRYIVVWLEIFGCLIYTAFMQPGIEDGGKRKKIINYVNRVQDYLLKYLRTKDPARLIISLVVMIITGLLILIFKERETLWGIPILHVTKLAIIAGLFLAGVNYFKKLWYLIILLMVIMGYTYISRDFSTLLFNVIAIAVLCWAMRKELKWQEHFSKRQKKIIGFLIAFFLIGSMIQIAFTDNLWWLGLHKTYRLLASYQQPSDSTFQHISIGARQSFTDHWMMQRQLFDNDYKPQLGNYIIPAGWRNTCFTDYSFLFQSIIGGKWFIILYTLIAFLLTYCCIHLLTGLSRPFWWIDKKDKKIKEHRWDMEKSFWIIYLLALTLVPILYCPLAMFLTLPVCGQSIPGLVPSIGEVLVLFVMLLILIIQIRGKNRFVYNDNIALKAINEREGDSYRKSYKKSMLFTISLFVILLLLAIGRIIILIEKQSDNYNLPFAELSETQKTLLVRAQSNSSKDSLRHIINDLVQNLDNGFLTLNSYASDRRLLRYITLKSTNQHPGKFAISENHIYQNWREESSYKNVYSPAVLRRIGDSTLKKRWEIYYRKGLYVVWSPDIALPQNSVIAQTARAYNDPILSDQTSGWYNVMINRQPHHLLSHRWLSGAPANSKTLDPLLHTLLNIELEDFIKRKYQKADQYLGSIWVIDNSTGAVLAAASYPMISNCNKDFVSSIQQKMRTSSFNPTLHWNEGIVNTAYTEATQGSINKVIIAYAALRIDTNVYKTRLAYDKNGKPIDFDRFLTESKNEYAAMLLRDVIWPNRQIAHKILKDELGIGLYTEYNSPGIIDDTNALKRYRWHPGNIKYKDKNDPYNRSAIGQQANIDMLSYLHAYLRIVSGQKMKVSFEKLDAIPEPLPDTSALKILRHHMKGVINNNSHGTARKVGSNMKLLQLNTTNWISKTGTAARNDGIQRASNFIVCTPSYTIGINLQGYLTSANENSKATDIFIAVAPLLKSFNILK